MTRHQKQEYIIYGILWGLIILAPLAFSGWRALSDRETFSLRGTVAIWLAELPFLVLFILHDLLAGRFFFRKETRIVYLVLTAVLLTLFGLWIFKGPDRRHLPGNGPRPRMEQRRDPPGQPDGAFWQQAPDRRPEDRPRMGDPARRKWPGRGPLTPDMLKFLLGLLMVAASLGLKSYFRSLRNEERLAALEQENLRQNLQYLRYQINPHFFMNTLNNIHALVDIDPEKAKASILELSKLMRYVLYEGDKPTIPLQKEVDFLSHYVGLMRIRYADSVDISFRAPEDTGGAEVPPLLFVTFVENAFKHGISYEEESFIRVKMETDGERIVFRCENSIHAAVSDGNSGIGLANVRKRLDLLYGEAYLLDVSEDDGVYRILVKLPFKPREI